MTMTDATASAATPSTDLSAGDAAWGVDLEAVERAEELIGRAFDDRSLLARALRHASVTDSRLDSNERMEFLGDAVLGMVVCEMIYARFPRLLEGEMTKIKSAAVSRRTCAEIACGLGLDELIVVGKGMQSADTLPQSLAAAVLESITAAVYLDGGYDAAREFLAAHLEPLIAEVACSGHQHNFKSVLQQVAQQRHAEAPQYRVLDEKGPDHAKAFKVGVELGGVRYEPSWGQSKKQAEQKAALNALRELGVASEDDDGVLRVELDAE